MKVIPETRRVSTKLDIYVFIGCYICPIFTFSFIMSV